MGKQKCSQEKRHKNAQAKTVGEIFVQKEKGKTMQQNHYTL